MPPKKKDTQTERQGGPGGIRASDLEPPKIPNPKKKQSNSNPKSNFFGGILDHYIAVLLVKAPELDFEFWVLRFWSFGFGFWTLECQCSSSFGADFGFWDGVLDLTEDKNSGHADPGRRISSSMYGTPRGRIQLPKCHFNPLHTTNSNLMLFLTQIMLFNFETSKQLRPPRPPLNPHDAKTVAKQLCYRIPESKDPFGGVDEHQENEHSGCFKFRNIVFICPLRFHPKTIELGALKRFFFGKIAKLGSKTDLFDDCGRSAYLAFGFAVFPPCKLNR